MFGLMGKNAEMKIVIFGRLFALLGDKGLTLKMPTVFRTSGQPLALIICIG